MLARQHSGSSPRERGTHLHAHLVALERRFIPARAGNAPVDTPQRPSSPVHPRASGERGDFNVPADRTCGSSPRERGTPEDEIERIIKWRFIPARAGNAGEPHGVDVPYAVHPRASGERCVSHLCKFGLYGSSPRERGTLVCRHVGPLARRFIPARAGNAVSVSRSSAPASVHPRASGERR